MFLVKLEGSALYRKIGIEGSLLLANTINPLINGGRLLILANLKTPASYFDAPVLLILATLVLLQMCADHFPKM